MTYGASGKRAEVSCVTDVVLQRATVSVTLNVKLENEKWSVLGFFVTPLSVDPRAHDKERVAKIDMLDLFNPGTVEVSLAEYSVGFSKGHATASGIALEEGFLQVDDAIE